MIHILILAGGKGTRMNSDLPKVLHPVKGVPIIKRLLSSMTEICETPSIIVGHKAAEVIAATSGKYHYIEQKEQLGTGHALMIAREALKEKSISTLVVLPGDHPLVGVETIKKLIENHSKSDAVVSLGTVKVEKNDSRLLVFSNYGRIVRDKHGKVDRIVEYKDATEEQRKILEFNISYYCFDAIWLWENIGKIGNKNASKEYYLTDIVQLAKEQGKHVDSHVITEVSECLGVNNSDQLKLVENLVAV